MNPQENFMMGFMSLMKNEKFEEAAAILCNFDTLELDGLNQQRMLAQGVALSSALNDEPLLRFCMNRLPQEISFDLLVEPTMELINNFKTFKSWTKNF